MHMIEVEPEGIANINEGGAYHWRVYKIESYLLPEMGKQALLYGCGDGGELPFLHKRGFSTTAIDIRLSPSTDILADGHCLPFVEESFDLVLSMQVLEHLHSPWLGVSEIARVVRPGGYFVGSVAFLKAFHHSYFHMSHMGVMHLLDSNGFAVDKIAGAQSLFYSLYGSLVPLGPRRFRRVVFGWVDQLLMSFRATLWSRRNRISAHQPIERWDLGFPIDYKTYDRLRVAPAVVFQSRKQAVDV